MFYLADTHALVWYIAGKIPPKVDMIFKESEKGNVIIFVPTIVLAEIMYLVKRRKIELDYAELLQRIEVSRNLVEVPFDFQILKMMLDVEISEIHDCAIVATAKLLNAKILTKDEEIERASGVECVWG
ncbi:MAG: hypothetical protein B5M48_02775 [Candidatus Omnitrophica bacterium 4484_213]|nr:MAG: hypothetical protein B5M48_02775 [Candidatus Omnitrophica bacterium 4484_213]